MLFSIIIPVYNTAPYLRDCLNSVLCQTFSDWEAVCVNDGSTDESESILHEYEALDQRIHVLSQANSGLSAARNAALSVAHGDWVFFLDSDDCLSAIDALKSLGEIVGDAKGSQVVAFNSELWYSEDNNRKEYNKLFNHENTILFSAGLDYLDYFVAARGWGPSAACFYLWKRDFLKKNNLTFPVGMLHEDELFVPMALLKAGGMLTSQKILYTYRIRSGSIAHGEQTWRRAKDKLRIAQQLQQQFRTVDIKEATANRIVYNLARNAAYSLPALSREWWKAKCLMWSNSQNMRDYIHIVWH